MIQMNTRNTLAALSLAAVVAVGSTACQKAQTPQGGAPEEAPLPPVEMKIAYVEVDSIMSQYKFCTDMTEELQKKSQNIQNNLTQREQALQNDAAAFQQKLEQNAYTQAEAESANATLQKRYNDLQELGQRLTTEFQAETEKFNTALLDSIQNYLKAYNKDKKYTLILTKAGDNILYADPQCDITAEVIAGLNKAYKPAPAKKDSDSKKK